jgi:sugar (pentulose or hexulose) kinase
MAAGFLAGIFDAEGSYNNGVIRISNTDGAIIGWLESSLRAFGFRYVVEHVHRTVTKPIDVIRITGGLRGTCVLSQRRSGNLPQTKYRRPSGEEYSSTGGCERRAACQRKAPLRRHDGHR